MDCFLQKCTVNDIHELRSFSIKTYSETFAPFNTTENMALYLNSAFDENKLLAELKNKNSEFYLLYSDSLLSGYLKINEAPAQTDIHDAHSLEIERIYIAKEHQRKGLGKFLLEYAVNLSKQRQKQYIWLGVWEKNECALHFYKQNGFYAIGSHVFLLGEDKQTDYIMRKDL